MTANAFDTLKAAKSLKAAGFDDAQAEAVVAAVGDAAREHTAPLETSTAAIGERMATKDDIANMATKDDIANMATKDDIANMATKDDIANMATKDDIANMATKDDVAKMVTKAEFAMLVDKVATISETMATKEYVKAAIAVEMKALYRHLWVMGTSVVGVTVALTKLLP